MVSAVAVCVAVQRPSPIHPSAHPHPPTLSLARVPGLVLSADELVPVVLNAPREEKMARQRQVGRLPPDLRRKLFLAELSLMVFENGASRTCGLLARIPPFLRSSFGVLICGVRAVCRDERVLSRFPLHTLL